MDGLKTPESLKTLILTEEDVKAILTMADTMRAVEHAFEMHGRNEIQMPPKVYLTFEKGDLRAMPAFLGGYAGLKWVNSHPENPEKGLPTVMAVLILNDPETGFPLAIMDATHITNMRTGAAGGIAAKYLARKDSKVFGFVGCGRQAYTQLDALLEVFSVEKVLAYDISSSHAEKFVSHCTELGIDAKAVDIREACNCDVLTTTTPSRKPVVKDEWIKEGTHINAIGADAPGKQELESSLLKRAKVVVDDMEQATHGGEVNVPISEGVIKPEDIYATLGEVIVGVKPGRESDEEITIFDSTGLAIQDISTASVVYENAIKRNVGLATRLFDFLPGR
ncbi:alanine dehydrogenase [Archaeoglobus veneficus]|uniref:Alanine dehydrogenase n=1 Tax=Archaeoglobus veneficus (strain DSM 11195 / SNP6) TaxID=693661 RepID=F2KSQ3_ARCVS|nr:alanine dehydrogenase [Archaeoglobus veneficus]AEA46948.1 alanine dehydrogenase [Archaeoglobus veneficus SNP6]